MRNYLRSECYRLLHLKSTWLVLLLLAGGVLFMNAGLAALNQLDSGFRYGTTSFSYSMVLAQPMIFCYMGGMLAYNCYERNKESQPMKNVMTSGLSRGKIFLAQSMVSFVIALVMLVVIMVCYIISAELLLQHSGPIEMADMFTAVAAMFLIATAGLVLGVVCVNHFERTLTGITAFFFVTIIVPTVLFFAGLQIPSIQGIVEWIPYDFFMIDHNVTMSLYEPFWRTDENMLKCIVSGLFGIITFGAAGVVLLRKKEY